MSPQFKNYFSSVWVSLLQPVRLLLVFPTCGLLVCRSCSTGLSYHVTILCACRVLSFVSSGDCELIGVAGDGQAFYIRIHTHKHKCLDAVLGWSCLNTSTSEWHIQPHPDVLAGCFSRMCKSDEQCTTQFLSKLKSGREFVTI